MRPLAKIRRNHARILAAPAAVAIIASHVRIARCRCFGRELVVASSILLTAFGSAIAADAPAVQEQAPQAAAPSDQPTLEPKALEILKASSARLAAAKTMKFTALAAYENPSAVGPPLVYTTTSDVALKRPDKLQVITAADGPAAEFYYDGKTFEAYAPAENLIAVADAPPTIDAALEAAYHEAAIYFPFSDVVVADPYKDLNKDLELAFYIGQSHVVGGTTTDMVAFATNNAFVQVWIGAEDKLPRMARAIYHKDPAQLRHQVEFSNWVLDGSLENVAFATPRAATATRIPFERPDRTRPEGRPPPSASDSSKPQ